MIKGWERLTREELITATQRALRLPDRLSAAEVIAIETGASQGCCVALDERGRVVPRRQPRPQVDDFLRRRR